MQVNTKHNVGDKAYLCLITDNKENSFFSLHGPLTVCKVEISASQILIKNENEKNPDPTINYRFLGFSGSSVYGEFCVFKTIEEAIVYGRERVQEKISS